MIGLYARIEEIKCYSTICAFCASIEILWLKIYNRCILLHLLEGHFEAINYCDLMLKNITLNGRGGIL
jgi:hypothetical protein